MKLGLVFVFQFSFNAKTLNYAIDVLLRHGKQGVPYWTGCAAHQSLLRKVFSF